MDLSRFILSKMAGSSIPDDASLAVVFPSHAAGAVLCEGKGRVVSINLRRDNSGFLLNFITYSARKVSYSP